MQHPWELCTGCCSTCTLLHQEPRSPGTWECNCEPQPLCGSLETAPWSCRSSNTDCWNVIPSTALKNKAILGKAALIILPISLYSKFCGISLIDFFLVLQLTLACSRSWSTIKRSTLDGFDVSLGIGMLLVLETFFPWKFLARADSVCRKTKEQLPQNVHAECASLQKQEKISDSTSSHQGFGVF